MAKLTSKLINKLPLPTGTGAREIPDELLKGLVFVLHHSGAGTWTVRYRNAEGQQRRLKLGRYPGMSVNRARDLGAAALRAVAKGEDPQQAKVAKRTSEFTDCFHDQAIRFIETYARPNNKSWVAQARLLGLSLDLAARRDPEAERRWAVKTGSPVARWQKRSVGSITKREVVEAVDAATTRGPIVANRVHATLTRFFSWAVEKGVIEISPTLGTKAPAPERSRDRVLSPDELALVWWAADALGPPFGPCVKLLILTGARRGEVAGMSRNELDGGVWTIPPNRSKNGEAHELPLPEFAVHTLDGLTGSESGLLFSGNGETPISGFSKFKLQLDAECRRLSKGRAMKSWVLHDIRRSVASGMAAIGVEPHIIEAILNHRGGVIKGVARVYNRHPYATEKKAALELWSRQVAAKSFSF